MTFTEEEFKELLQKNPALRATRQGGKPSEFLLQIKGEDPAEAKPPKYFNKKIYEFSDGVVSPDKQAQGHGTVVNVYDSTKEYIRWQELRTLEMAGKITDLTRQSELLLQEAFAYRGERVRKIAYKADFRYVLSAGTVVVEDVKAFAKKTGKFLTTKDFSLKWKMLKYRYPDILFLLH